jgi:hypothetical protein
LLPNEAGVNEDGKLLRSRIRNDIVCAGKADGDVLPHIHIENCWGIIVHTRTVVRSRPLRESLIAGCCRYDLFGYCGVRAYSGLARLRRIALQTRFAQRPDSLVANLTQPNRCLLWILSSERIQSTEGQEKPRHKITAHAIFSDVKHAGTQRLRLIHCSWGRLGRRPFAVCLSIRALLISADNRNSADRGSMLPTARASAAHPFAIVASDLRVFWSREYTARRAKSTARRLQKFRSFSTTSSMSERKQVEAPGQ